MDHADDLLRVAHVGHDREALPAHFLDTAERFGGVASGALVDADDGAFRGKTDRGCLSHSVGGPRHESDFADESLFHWNSSA